jgi:choline-sulfatase
MGDCHMIPSMRRLLFVAVVAFALALSCRSKDTDSPSFPGAPMVLISIDTLRADHLPAYGYGGVETPHLDALRKDAILFANAYSHCPLTLPSHVSILTGLLPPDHGVRDNLGYAFDGRKHPGLASFLKSKGYATGAAVSAYVLRGATGLSDSFDVYDDEIKVPPGSESASLAQRKGDETELRAARWLEAVSHGPFFLFFHIYEPHLPYDPPEPFKSRYPLAYDGEIATSDAIVGRLLDTLKERGLYDRSIVLLLSDHGEGLGEHGEADHGILLYREVLRVPLLLKLPRSRRGGETITRPVGLIDVAPTALALLGVPLPPTLRGSSLLGREEKSIYSETFYPRLHFGWSELRSLVDARYHFIDAPGPELYRVDSDPHERSNVIRDHEPLAHAMKAELGRSPGAFHAPFAADPEALEKLRSLGYLGGAAETSGEGALPDPKDHLREIDTIHKGFTLAASGRNLEALSVLGALLKENPRIVDVRFKVGEILLELGRPQEALEQLTATLAMSPSLALGVAPALARAQLALGKRDDAEASARLLLNGSPAEAHQLLAQIAFDRNDLEAADREARWLTQNPTTALDGTLIAAQVLLRRDRFQEALRLLDGARAKTGSPPPVSNIEFLRGDALARLNRLPEAEAAFRAEIQSFPKNSLAFARLAITCALEGRSVKEVYGILDSMEQSNPGAQTELLAARTLDSLGDRAGAETWRRRARRP